MAEVTHQVIMLKIKILFEELEAQMKDQDYEFTRWVTVDELEKIHDEMFEIKEGVKNMRLLKHMIGPF